MGWMGRTRRRRIVLKIRSRVRLAVGVLVGFRGRVGVGAIRVEGMVRTQGRPRLGVGCRVGLATMLRPVPQVFLVGPATGSPRVLSSRLEGLVVLRFPLRRGRNLALCFKAGTPPCLFRPALRAWDRIGK